MNFKQKQQQKQILHQELVHIKTFLPLPGINDQIAQDVFIKQILDSIRRVQFVYTQRQRNISFICTDPYSPAFDPIKAAIYYSENDQTEEAYWLIFLSTFCGKHGSKHWEMLIQFYSLLGSKQNLTWDFITNNFVQFSTWYEQNYSSITRAFGNHRKFETLKKDSTGSPIAVFDSYIHWVGNSHLEMTANAIKVVGDEPKILFDYFYNSMSIVKQFGRTSRFDYLAMLGKVGLVNIEPPSVYLNNSTGPIRGQGYYSAPTLVRENMKKKY